MMGHFQNQNQFQFQILFLPLLLLIGCSRLSGGGELRALDASRSFAENQIRYMSPLDLLNTLDVNFPGARLELEPAPAPDSDGSTRMFPIVNANCSSLTIANRALIGDSSAMTGSPLFSEPSSAFVRWYSQCVRLHLKALHQRMSRDPSIGEAHYGPTLWQTLQNGEITLTQPFSQLTPDLQLTLVAEQIEARIGPSEVIADFGYFTDTQALAEHLLKIRTGGDQVSVRDAVDELIFLLTLRDEFLSY